MWTALSVSPAKVAWALRETIRVVMLSGERSREASSGAVEASLPPNVLPGGGIPRFARNDKVPTGRAR